MCHISVLAQVQNETFFEAKLFFVASIFLIMQEGSMHAVGWSPVWRFKRSQDATFYDIATPAGELTVVLATRDETETMGLYNRLERSTGKTVLHVAVAAGEGRADYAIDDVQVHQVPMYHKGRVRDEGLENFWIACKETAAARQAVLIHCNQSFHRGPLAFTAIMVRAGYTKEVALDMIADRRCIFAGHMIPYDEWPFAEQQDPHAQDLLECHRWLERLPSDDAPFSVTPGLSSSGDVAMPNAGQSLDDAEAPEADDGHVPAVALPAYSRAGSFSRQWPCSTCQVVGPKLLECWVCGRWDCKRCAFWCTHCPYKYTICSQCNAEGFHLHRQGKRWWCPRC